MKKELLVVKTVDVEDVEKAQKVSLQALNMMRDKAIYDIYFLEGMNRLVVSYLKEKEETGNIAEVIDSWGEVSEWVENKYLVTVTPDDLTNDGNKELDNTQDESYEKELSEPVYRFDW